MIDTPQATTDCQQAVWTPDKAVDGNELVSRIYVRNNNKEIELTKGDC